MPRAGLSTAVVVAEAARLVDTLGWDRLTLTAVAEAFGVAVPSLYKHVGGLEDLKRRLAAAAVRELDRALSTAATGKARGEALGAMADAYRAYASAHPGRYAATLGAPDLDDAEHRAATEALLGTVYATLAGYGLSGEDAVDATRAIRSSLHGFASLEAGGGFRLPQDLDRSFHRLVAALDAALDRWGRPSPADAPGWRDDSPGPR